MKHYLSKLIPTKKRIQIEFCKKNLDRHLQNDMIPEFSEFLNHSRIAYKEYECLGYCQSCRKQLYAIINGKMIEAENAKDLLQLLKSKESSR